MSENYLIHYGVLGMKWGVRNEKNRSSSNSRTKRVSPVGLAKKAGNYLKEKSLYGQMSKGQRIAYYLLSAGVGSVAGMSMGMMYGLDAKTALGQVAVSAIPTVVLGGVTIESLLKSAD